MRGERASVGVRVSATVMLAFLRRAALGPARASAHVDVGVEVAAVAGGRDKARADRKRAEALAWLPLVSIGLEQRIERRHDAVVIEVLGVELGQPRAVEGRAEIEV